MARYNTQEITVTGRLTKDATLRVNPDGKDFIELSIASNSYKKGEGESNSKATFYNAKIFSNGAEKIVDFAKKGTQVLVTGSYDQNVSMKDGKTYVFNNINNAKLEMFKDDFQQSSQQQTEEDVVSDLFPD